MFKIREKNKNVFLNFIDFSNSQIEVSYGVASLLKWGWGKRIFYFYQICFKEDF